MILNYIDISIILSWLLWILYSITHRHPLGVWSKQQKLWYLNTIETSKIGFKYEYYLLYYIIIIPLFTLSLWNFTINEGKNESSSSSSFTFIIILIIITIFIEKIWNIFHWDKKKPKIAYYISILISILYMSTLFIIIIYNGFSRYIFLILSLLIQIVWFSFHSFIEYRWLQYPCLCNPIPLTKRKIVNNSISTSIKTKDNNSSELNGFFIKYI
jgi:hypothetical protein